MAQISLEIPDEQLPLIQGIFEQLLTGLQSGAVQVTPSSDLPIDALPGGDVLPGGDAFPGGEIGLPPGPLGGPIPPGGPTLSPEEEALLIAELEAGAPSRNVSRGNII